MEREMKDSGIAWIGEIPKEWEASKLGTLYTNRNEKVSDKDFPPLSVTMKGILPQLETAAKTDDGDNRKLVRKGDFAINSRSDRRGSCGISPYDGSVSLINTILCPRDEMNPSFYNWLFHTSLFADEFYKWGHGIVDDLWTTRWQEMKNIYVVVPNLKEQQSIAHFLDEKCSEIDELISLQEKMIDELKSYKQSVITEAVTKGLDRNVKMKDSGVDWIGEIPKHWGICRIKETCKNISDGTHFSPETKDEGYSYITAGDVHGKGIDFSKTKRISEIDYLKLVSQGCQPHQNDVLIVKDGATTGRVGLMTEVQDCVLLSSVAMLTVNSNYSNLYLFYILQSDTIQEQIRLSMAGSAMPRITLTKLNNFLTIISPLSEQQEIADYLDTKCSEIDTLISIKQQKIEELKEYKKSLIYEYVTGKKQVI